MIDIPWEEEFDGQESRYCYGCDNTGEIMICCDDICRGIGYCMHGDGVIICPECNGESIFWDDAI